MTINLLLHLKRPIYLFVEGGDGTIYCDRVSNVKGVDARKRYRVATVKAHTNFERLYARACTCAGFRLAPEDNEGCKHQRMLDGSEEGSKGIDGESAVHLTRMILEALEDPRADQMEVTGEEPSLVASVTIQASIGQTVTADAIPDSWVPEGNSDEFHIVPEDGQLLGLYYSHTFGKGKAKRDCGVYIVDRDNGKFPMPPNAWKLKPTLTS